MQWLTKKWLILSLRDSKSPDTLRSLVLRLLVPDQGSALGLLGGLQRSADPLLISSYLRRKKRPSAFYKLDLEHKNGGMTNCLEKPQQMYSSTSAQAKNLISLLMWSRQLSLEQNKWLSCKRIFWGSLGNY